MNIKKILESILFEEIKKLNIFSFYLSKPVTYSHKVISENKSISSFYNTTDLSNSSFHKQCSLIITAKEHEKFKK